MSMYVSENRVERDGFLIAFAGEQMSEEDAEARGLIGVTNGDSGEVALGDMTVKQLCVVAEECGIELPKKANKAEIVAAIETALAKDEKSGSDEGDEGKE